MMDNSKLPQWLTCLLGEKFFNACIIHEDVKKNEKNIFCLDCCESICPHCLAPHHTHRLLQIRRYVYHDVLRLVDAEKLMDCSLVQYYSTNSSRVVFINQRPITRACRVSSNICATCDRGLQEPYIYCCLSCKLQHVLRSGAKLSQYVHEVVTLSEPGLDDGQMTPESILDPSGSMRTESCSSGSRGMDCNKMNGCTAATTEVVRRKKRSSVPSLRPGFQPVQCGENSESIMNRRKGTPHRSPLY